MPRASNRQTAIFWVSACSGPAAAGGGVSLCASRTGASGRAARELAGVLERRTVAA
jgi:hypothetical protein